MHRARWLWIVILVFAVTAAPLAAQKTIPVDSAIAYVGQTVAVEGVVANVGTSRRSGTIFLDFGAPYPRSTFTAVIFRSAATGFPDVRALVGKKVRVIGTVRLYRGKPEIILDKPSQIAPE